MASIQHRFTPYRLSAPHARTTDCTQLQRLKPLSAAAQLTDASLREQHSQEAGESYTARGLRIACIVYGTWAGVVQMLRHTRLSGRVAD